MLVLVANLGSTSFKFRLFRMAEDGGTELASGGAERVKEHATVIEASLDDLCRRGVISHGSEIDAVAFKAVLGKGISGCVIADDAVIAAIEEIADVAPAHNPAYAEGIRQFARLLPTALRIALFETAFYQWMPEAATCYAIPPSWRDIGIRRHGFHGASHKHVAETSAAHLGRDDVARIAADLYCNGPVTLEGRPLRVISCHLGGSSSVTAIRNGVAVATSMGFSPQSGVPQNNRVGDLDASALPYAMRKLGLSLEEAELQLSRESGMFGLSAVSNDIRDIIAAAAEGNAQAKLAIDVYVHSVRHWIGASLVALGGVDALVFTAGMGENQHAIRAAICDGLEIFGLCLDAAKNAATTAVEADISRSESAARILVIPANEEKIIAREVFRKFPT